MAVVKMRELLRDPKSVFETLERSGEPIVLTRDGQAVAALYPINPERAAEMAMAALPEFVDSRGRARDARREGRTATAAEFLDEFAARHDAAAAGGTAAPAAATPALPLEGAEQTASVWTGEDLESLSRDVEVLFGHVLSRDLVSGLDERIASASAPVLAAAAATQAEDVENPDFANRVHQLTCQLFGSLLHEQLQRTALDVLAVGSLSSATVDSEQFGGVFGKVAAQTLDAVTARVTSVNCQVIDNPPWPGTHLSLQHYESFIRGAGALERTDPVRLYGASPPAAGSSSVVG